MQIYQSLLKPTITSGNIFVVTKTNKIRNKILLNRIVPVQGHGTRTRDSASTGTWNKIVMVEEEITYS